MTPLAFSLARVAQPFELLASKEMDKAFDSQEDHSQMILFSTLPLSVAARLMACNMPYPIGPGNYWQIILWKNKTRAMLQLLG